MEQRKNSHESPWGMEPQTLGFCALMLYHWVTETLWWTRPLKSSASSKFIIFLIVHVKKALSTLLIPAICWTHVIFELWNGLAHLRGSVVEHQSAESKGLRFDSSWLHGDSEFFLCLMLVTRPETSFFKQNVFAKTTSFGMFDGRSKLCLRKHT